MLSLIQRIIYGPKTVFTLDIPALRDCARCKSIVSMRMALRFTTHLVEDHKMPDDHAYETADWVFARLKEHLRK